MLVAKKKKKNQKDLNAQDKVIMFVFFILNKRQLKICFLTDFGYFIFPNICKKKKKIKYVLRWKNRNYFRGLTRLDTGGTPDPVFIGTPYMK